MVRGCLCLAEIQQFATDAGEQGCIPSIPHFSSLQSVIYMEYLTLQKDTHAHSQFLLGLSLSLKDWFVLLSLEELSYSTKIIYGDLHIINDNLMDKYFHIQLKWGTQKYFKKQSVLIDLIYSPGMFLIYFVLLTFLHNLKSLLMGSFPQFPSNGSYMQSYLFKTEIFGITTL